MRGEEKELAPLGAKGAKKKERGSEAIMFVFPPHGPCPGLFAPIQFAILILTNSAPIYFRRRGRVTVKPTHLPCQPDRCLPCQAF